MGYMDFRSQLLEKYFKRFKWSRNITIDLFEEAENKIIFDYTPKSKKFTFQNILFQFQCIVTTTDTYLRKLTGHKNEEFGIYMNGEKEIKKKDIAHTEIEEILKSQLKSLEYLLKDFDEKKSLENFNDVMNIMNHEYLHQGQLIIMFREAGVELPERFKNAWAL